MSPFYDCFYLLCITNHYIHKVIMDHNISVWFHLVELIISVNYLLDCMYECIEVSNVDSSINFGNLCTVFDSYGFQLFTRCSSVITPLWYLFCTCFENVQKNLLFTHNPLLQCSWCIESHK